MPRLIRMNSASAVFFCQTLFFANKRNQKVAKVVHRDGDKQDDRRFMAAPNEKRKGSQQQKHVTVIFFKKVVTGQHDRQK